MCRSLAIILLVCLEVSYTVIAFRSTISVRSPRLTNMQMSKPSGISDSVQRKIKSAMAAVVIAASTMDVSFAFADTPTVPVTRSALEQSIQTLEAANTRSEVIQSLADVFEAAGTKTLLVRTKYKYVSSPDKISNPSYDGTRGRKPYNISLFRIFEFIYLAHCECYQR